MRRRGIIRSSEWRLLARAIVWLAASLVTAPIVEVLDLPEFHTYCCPVMNGDVVGSGDKTISVPARHDYVPPLQAMSFVVSLAEGMRAASNHIVTSSYLIDPSPPTPLRV